MAKVFLDTNIFIDLVEKRSEISLQDLDEHDVYISPLSLHILHYVTKQKVPYKKLLSIIDQFSLVTITVPLCYMALEGPTNDFEDNVQLHSAEQADCIYFLTHDKQLLTMKFFGKMRIVSTL